MLDLKNLPQCIDETKLHSFSLIKQYIAATSLTDKESMEDFYCTRCLMHVTINMSRHSVERYSTITF